MANNSLADQLDDAIEMMIAEPGSAPPKVDLKIGELLGIAAELRLLPDPAFRAALKSQLLAQSATVAAVERKPWRPEALGEPILPALFGAGRVHYPVRRWNLALSMAMHAALLLAVVGSTLWLTKAPLAAHVETTVVTNRPYRMTFGYNGGGGERAKQPESKGSLPRFFGQPLTLPTLAVRAEPPMLDAAPTILGPPELTLPPSRIGNPLGVSAWDSNGPGYGGGMGSGHCGGMGSGSGAYRVGGGVTAPRAIYDPDPEYSEEARQAKYQGTVLLWVVVGTDGKAREIRVQRSLGMGLDEKAVEAVRGWKFQPGTKAGVPVAVEIGVDVTFRLF